MLLGLLVFLGGVLTILSPCILPVLPFVFARSEQKFLTSGLPMLLGMAGTFAGIATLAAVGGAWAVRVNQYGRIISMVMLAAFAATLLSRRLGSDAKPVRFRVQLDGADTDANGNGVIREERLYQLIRQSADVGDHVFSIEFLDSDARAYAFTFG